MKKLIVMVICVCVVGVTLAGCSDTPDSDIQGTEVDGFASNTQDSEVGNGESLAQEPVRFDTGLKLQPEQGKTFTHYEDMTVNDIEIYRRVADNGDVIFYYINNSGFDVVGFHITFMPLPEHSDNEDITARTVGITTTTRPGAESEDSWVFANEELKVSDLDYLLPNNISMTYLVNEDEATLGYFFESKMHSYWFWGDEEPATTETTDGGTQNFDISSNKFIELWNEDSDDYALILTAVGAGYDDLTISDETFDKISQREGLLEMLEEVFDTKFEHGYIPSGSDFAVSVAELYNELVVQYPDAIGALETSLFEPGLQLGSTDMSDWRQFLREYEEIVDEYIAVLQKYQDNPTDPSIMSDFVEYFQRLGEWAGKSDEIQLQLADSPEALREYRNMLLRIIGKLSEVG